MNTEAYGVILSILAALSWSISAIFYKKGEKGLSSIESNAIRCLLPLITLIACSALLSGESFLDLNPRLFLYVLLATLIALVIGDTLFLLSIRFIGVSISVSVTYTFPIFTSLFAFVFLNEVLHPLTYLGVLLTVIGIMFLNRGGSSGNGVGNNFKIGFISATLASISWAAGITLFRFILFSYDPLNLTTWRMIVLTLFLLPFGIKSLKKTSLKNIVYLNLGGFFGLALGGIFLYFGLNWIGASKTSTITSATPLFSALLAILFLNERLVSQQYAGIFLITLGLLIVTLF